jgi:hypothetical protein
MATLFACVGKFTPCSADDSRYNVPIGDDAGDTIRALLVERARPDCSAAPSMDLLWGAACQEILSTCSYPNNCA